jgi:hypothetical protein
MSKMDQHVCLFDPAIRWGDTTKDDNVTDRDTWPVERDPKRLHLHEGKRAMIFHCIKLDFPQVAFCKEAPEVEACGRAFRTGVRRVTRPDGTTWLPAGVEERGYSMMSLAEMSEFETVIIEEIGALILQSGRLPFDLKGSYMLRPSSLHVSGATERALRCVELNQARAILRQQSRVPTP